MTKIMSHLICKTIEQECKHPLKKKLKIKKKLPKELN